MNPAFIASDEEAERAFMPTIQELAAKAASIQQDLDSSIQEANEAEANAITAVIALVKPALRSISCRAKTHYRSWWVGNTHTDKEEEYHPTRVVKLVDGMTHRKDGSGNSGSTEGTNVYLTVDGKLLKFEYEGHWSSWQGSTDEWNAEVTEITVGEAVKQFKLDAEEVMKVLSGKLEEVINGKATEKAKANRTKAEKLKAIMTLMRK